MFFRVNVRLWAVKNVRNGVEWESSGRTNLNLINQWKLLTNSYETVLQSSSVGKKSTENDNDCRTPLGANQSIISFELFEGLLV